jgi:Tol biopolymer transport system component
LNVKCKEDLKMKANRTCLILILTITGLFLSGAVAMPQQNAGQLYEKALYLEEAKGSLQDAIDLYNQIAENKNADQSFQAKALLHMGLCYEKLGKQEAVKSYQRLVNNFPTYKNEVAIARERLTLLIPITEKVTKVSLIPKFTKINIPSILSWNAATSPDGQQLLLVYDEKLWTMPLSGKLGSDIPGKPVQIGTDGVKVIWAGLSWSTDGKTIAFNEDNRQYLKDIPENEKKNQNIYIISSEGGNPEKIIENYCDALAVNYRISLSPDGKTLAYSSVNTDKMHIYSIPVKDGIPRKLVETEAREPVFSPDGKMIAYVEDKGLGKQGGGLWTVSASGGNPNLVTKAGNASSPVWSPDGNNIGFIDYNEKNKINIIPVNKDGKQAGEKITIDAPEGTNEVTLLTGWSRNNKIGTIISRVKYGLYTMPSDGGQAVMVFNGDASQPRWSPDVKHIFFRKAADQQEREQGWADNKLSVIPADGGEDKNILTLHDRKVGFMPYGTGIRVSPNGQKIVFSGKKIDDDTVYINRYPTTQIWTTPINGSELTKITNPPAPYSDDSPCWSPDGKSVAFLRTELKESRMNMYGEMGIYVINSSGGVPKLLMSEPEKFIYSINWSPDGKSIAYLKGDKRNNPDIISTLEIVNVENRLSRTVCEVTGFTVFSELTWSPDGKRIAFNDNIKEGKVIKVVSVDNGKIEDIETGLVNARIYNLDWSPDGKRFVFAGYQDGVPEFWLLEDFLPLIENNK